MTIQIISGMHITTIKNPTFVTFLENNIIAIANSHSFALYNVRTKAPILNEQSYGTIYHVAVNTTKTKCAISSPDKFAVYNNQGVLLYQKIYDTPINHTYPIAFTSNDEVIIHDNAYLSFFTEDTKTSGIFSRSIQNTRFYISQPPLYLYHTNQGLTERNSKKGHYALLQKNPEKRRTNENYNKNYIAAYSPEGKSIAVIKKDQSCSLYKKNSCASWVHKPSGTLFLPSKKTYTAMKFHPNNTMLCLLTTDNAIEWWNYHTQTLEKTVPLHSQGALNRPESLIDQRLDISNNGQFIITALQQYCLLTCVPFEFLGSTEMQKQIIYFTLCLRKYFCARYLPEDILHIIMKKICKLYISNQHNT